MDGDRRRSERRRGQRGPGPLGPNAKRFNVWIPEPLFASIERIAARNRVDTAVVIRDMLRKALSGETTELLSHTNSSQPQP